MRMLPKAKKKVAKNMAGERHRTIFLRKTLLSKKFYSSSVLARRFGEQPQKQTKNYFLEKQYWYPRPSDWYSSVDLM